MIASYRCSICGISHPPREPWDTECAGCGGPTDAMQHAQPNITHEEAQTKRSYRLFDEWLEREQRE